MWGRGGCALGAGVGLWWVWGRGGCRVALYVQKAIGIHVAPRGHCT